MRTFFILLTILCLNVEKAFSQYFSVSSTDNTINELFSTDDSTFAKIVDRVCLTGTVADEKNREFTLDVTKFAGGIMEIPDSLRSHHLQNQELRIFLKGLLCEVFRPENGRNSKYADSLIQSFPDAARQILLKLKKLTFSKNVNESDDASYVIVYGLDGQPRLEYFETSKINFDVYTTSDFQKVPFHLTYSPVFADIYFVPKSEWLYKYNLKIPIVGSQVGKMFDRFIKYRVQHAKNDFYVSLDERAYVVVYNRHGKLAFDLIEPSTINTANNTKTFTLDE